MAKWGILASETSFWIFEVLPENIWDLVRAEKNIKSTIYSATHSPYQCAQHAIYGQCMVAIANIA